jgi:putative hydroxymethylpyrimidine transport system substrate-binding protein
MRIARTLIMILVIAAGLAPLSAAAADKLTVLLDWFVNPDHLPLVIAKQGGYFARHGLDVDLVEPADASAPPRLVAAGSADIAVTYQPDLMLQRNAGLPLVRFGTLIASPLNCLIALKGGPVRSLADLKGKTIGYSVAGFQEAYLEEMLASIGLTLGDVTLVNLNLNLVPALMSGKVDAIVGGFRNFEPIDLSLHGKDPVVFLPEEHGVPPYDELIYVTREALKGDPRLPRFLAAIREATDFIAERPAQAYGMFVAAHKDLDDELDHRSFAATLPLLARDPAALDANRYDHFAAFMKVRGLIGTVPPLDAYAIELR